MQEEEEERICSSSELNVDYLAAGQPARAPTTSTATAILIIMVSVVCQRSRRILSIVDMPLMYHWRQCGYFLNNFGLSLEDMHGRVRGIKAIGKWAGHSLPAEVQEVSSAVTESEATRPTENICVQKLWECACLNGNSKCTKQYMCFVTCVTHTTPYLCDASDEICCDSP